MSVSNQKGNNENSTNESDSSTDSNSDQKISVRDSQHMEGFNTLKSILNMEILDQDSGAGKTENSILVESFTIGLGGQYDLIDQIPCVSSADKTQFIVFFDKLDVESF
jgi:hypothetical protein